MTAKQQSEVREWKEAEERHAQDRITKRNGMDQRMTKVRGKAFRYASRTAPLVLGHFSTVFTGIVTTGVQV